MTNAQKEWIVEAAKEAIRNGKDLHIIVGDVILGFTEKFKSDISTTTAKSYVMAAAESLSEEIGLPTDVPNKSFLVLSIMRLTSLYRKAEDKGDIKLAFEIAREIAKISGAYAGSRSVGPIRNVGNRGVVPQAGPLNIQVNGDLNVGAPKDFNIFDADIDEGELDAVLEVDNKPDNIEEKAELYSKIVGPEDTSHVVIKKKDLKIFHQEEDKC